MRFSVIIPAHNAAGRIRRCLDSVASQSFRDYELIVICDSCTDDTQAIARSYGAVTEAVDFHRDGLTRDRGLDIANGQFVMFLDDDDWWLHEYCLQLIDGKLNDVPFIDVLCFSFIWRGVGYARPKDNGGSYFPAVWSKCWRRSHIGDTRFGDRYASSDFDFSTAMFQKPTKAYDWDMPIVYYNYLRPGSISEVAQRGGTV